MIVAGRQRLHLDPDVPVAHQIQYLGEQRQRLAVASIRTCLASASESCEIGPTPGDLRVVVNDDTAVSGRVDIQLDPVGVEHDRAAKGRSRVFVFVSGSAAVGDHTWASHRPKIARHSPGRPT